MVENLKLNMLSIHFQDKSHTMQNLSKDVYMEWRSHIWFNIFIYTGEKQDICVICEKQHMLTHTGEKPQQYHVRDKLFTTVGDSGFHVLIHSEENPHKCNICEKQFTQAVHLDFHIIDMSRQEDTQM